MVLLTNYDLVPLNNAKERAQSLKQWGYATWELSKLNEPKTEKYKKKPCWLCGKKTYTRDNPVYVQAVERQRKYYYDELVTLLELTESFERSLPQEVTAVGDGLPASAADDRQFIKGALLAIYDAVESAEEQKQLTPTSSITNQINDVKEAMALIRVSLSTVMQEKLQAGQQSAETAETETGTETGTPDRTQKIAIAGIVTALAIGALLIRKYALK